VAERAPDPIRTANVEYNMQELTAKLEEVRLVLESVAATFTALTPKIDEARATVGQVQGQVQQVALQAGIALETPPPTDPAQGAHQAEHPAAPGTGDRPPSTDPAHRAPETPAHATPPPATPRTTTGRRGDKDDD
jgi:hypothetical protein